VGCLSVGKDALVQHWHGRGYRLALVLTVRLKGFVQPVLTSGLLIGEVMSSKLPILKHASKEALEAGLLEASDSIDWAIKHIEELESQLSADLDEANRHLKSEVDRHRETGECLIEAKASIKIADYALNAWTHTYAPEMCDADDVAKARAHIESYGGTLAYIASVRKVLAEWGW
jgi:hypothetical protein